VKGRIAMMYLDGISPRNSTFVVGSCLMWLKWHDIDYSMTAQFCVTPAVGPEPKKIERLRMSAVMVDWTCVARSSTAACSYAN
jgi:hypothetical protein